MMECDERKKGVEREREGKRQMKQLRKSKNIDIRKVSKNDPSIQEMCQKG